MQKGPYFNPVQYISPLPEGYLQASSNIANTMGKAMQGFGENIASGIEKYTKNKEESALLDSQAPIILRDLQLRAKTAKNPDDIAYFTTLGNKLAKMPGQSIAQKRAIISGLSTELSLYDKRQQSQINQNQIENLRLIGMLQETVTQSFGLPTTRDEQRQVPTSSLKDYSQYLYDQNQPPPQQQAQPEFMNSLAAIQANRPQLSGAPMAQPQAASINPAAFVTPAQQPAAFDPSTTINRISRELTRTREYPEGVDYFASGGTDFGPPAWKKQPATTGAPVMTAHTPAPAPAQLPKPTAFEASAGMIARGTVNLFEQPSVQNKDGTISTVDSVGVNIKGKEYLLPTVTPDGRHFEGTLKEKAAQATEEFNKTGQHLGVFKSVAASNNYAAQLHNDYAAGRYDKPSQGSQFDQSFKQNIDRVDQTSKRTVTDKVDLTPNEKYTNQIASIISGGGQITPELNAQLKKDAGVYADADIKTEQIKDAQGRVVGTAVISRGTLTNLVLPEKPIGPQSDTGKKITDMHSLLAQGNFAGAQLIANELKQGSSKMTEGQSKAMQYASELFQTNKTIARLEAAGFNPTNNTWDRFAPNFFKSDEGQQYYSAMDKWIEATLRDRSGAAIQPSEYGNARSQYFPNYGDSAANIANKKELRNVAMQAMADRAEGKMNNRYFGSTGETSEQRKLPSGQTIKIERF